MKRNLFGLSAIALMLFSATVVVGQDRPASPPGMASTQIGEAWIDVTYSRPILRGRHGIFGEGEKYGETVLGNAEYWRAGANATTQLETGLPLVIGDKTVPAGKYGVIIGLDEKEWTLVLTSQDYMEEWKGREEVAKGVLWGSYGYKPEYDVARAPMKVDELDHSVDQMTIGFLDVDESGATLAVWWDDTRATVRLKTAK